jgi:hypothetical protein
MKFKGHRIGGNKLKIGEILVTFGFRMCLKIGGILVIFGFGMCLAIKTYKKMGLCRKRRRLERKKITPGLNFLCLQIDKCAISLTQ